MRRLFDPARDGHLDPVVSNTVPLVLATTAAVSAGALTTALVHKRFGMIAAALGGIALVGLGIQWSRSMSRRKSILNRRNESEVLFAHCLHKQGYCRWSYEPSEPGRSRRPDYRVRLWLQAAYFEIKSFEQDDLVIEDGGAYDPYKEIREKINQLRAQFREYKHACCVGVLFNSRAPLVDLDRFDIVMAAMLGDLSIRLSIDTTSGIAVGPAQTLFSGKRAKMIRPKGDPQNTTISALIALDPLDVGQRETMIAAAREEKRIGRKLESTEFWDFLQQRPTRSGHVMRVIVYENPFARVRFSRHWFRGPLDERFGEIADGKIGRLYVGHKLAAIEAEERTYGLNRGAVAKLFEE